MRPGADNRRYRRERDATPWRLAGPPGSVDPGKPGPLVFAGKPVEIAAKRCAELAWLTHRLSAGNAGPRKNTWWCNPRNRNRQP